MTTQSRNVGFIIALIGSGLALLSFFTMLYLILGLFSFTGEQIASLGAQYGNNSNGGQGLVYLWLAPAIALVMLVIAALQLPSSRQLATKKIAAGWLIGIAVVTFQIIVGLFIYLYDSQNPGSPSFVSFWESASYLYPLEMNLIICFRIFSSA